MLGRSIDLPDVDTPDAGGGGDLLRGRCNSSTAPPTSEPFPLAGAAAAAADAGRRARPRRRARSSPPPPVHRFHTPSRPTETQVIGVAPQGRARDRVPGRHRARRRGSGTPAAFRARHVGATEPAARRGAGGGPDARPRSSHVPVARAAGRADGHDHLRPRPPATAGCRDPRLVPGTARLRTAAAATPKPSGGAASARANRAATSSPIGRRVACVARAARTADAFRRQLRSCHPKARPMAPVGRRSRRIPTPRSPPSD